MTKRKPANNITSFYEEHVSLDNKSVIRQIKCDATNRIEPRIMQYLDSETNTYKTIKVSRIANNSGEDALKILVTEISNNNPLCEYEFKSIKESGYAHMNDHLILHLIGGANYGSNCQRYGTHIMPGEHVNLGGPNINIGEYRKIGCSKIIHKHNELNKKQLYRLQQVIRNEDTDTLIVLVQNISDPDSKLIIREFPTIKQEAYSTLDNHIMLHIIGAVVDYNRSKGSCITSRHNIEDEYKISYEDNVMLTDMFPQMLTLTGDNVFPFSEIDASLVMLA